MPKDNKELTNQEIEQSLVELSGGISLRELIENGRLLKANGERFIPAGKKIQYSIERVDYSNEEMDVFEAIRNNGVFFFNGVNKDKPDFRPTFIKQAIKTTLVDSDDSQELVEESNPLIMMSDPIEPKNVVNQVVNGDWEELKDDGPTKLALPGIFNRMLDGISRFFGGKGTDAMNAYRKNQEEIKQHDDMIANAKIVADKVNAHSSELKAEKASQKNKSVDMRWITQALSPEALGYDLDDRIDIARYDQDENVIASFTEQICELAESDYKARHLLRVMGSHDSHNPADNSIRTLYSAYRNEVYNGRDLNIKDMISDAAHKRETVNTMNLDFILAGKAPMNTDQNNLLPG